MVTITAKGIDVAEAAPTPLILAVDDDIVTLQLAQDMLGEQGFKIVTAASGEAALTDFDQACADNQSFDVIW